MIYVVLAHAIYTVVFAFILNIKGGWKASLLFQAIPGALALGSFVYAVSALGWL